MNRTPTFVSFLVAALVALAVSVISCGDTIDEVAAAGENTEVAAEPTAERLIERSKARWDLVVAAQQDEERWIEIYDFELPQVKRAQTLGMFLEGKEKFHYDSPTPPQVLLIEEDKGYIQVDCTWLAYKHPVIGQNDPGLTHLMEMLEVWHWVEGDWYMVGGWHERPEYFRENPEFGPKIDAYLAAQDEKAAGN